MANQLLITYQTNVLTTWFLILPLDEYNDNTKAQSLKFESKTHEAQLEDQKPKKAQEGHLEEGKTAKASKRHEKQHTKQKGKEELRKAQKHKKSQNSP
jgi:hypothetical protein